MSETDECPKSPDCIDKMIRKALKEVYKPDGLYDQFIKHIESVEIDKK